MRSYQTLPDISEKEKIVGGLLNINQLFWLIGGVVFGGIMFAFTYKINVRFGGFLFLTGILSSVPFVFIKPKGLTFFRYLYLKYKYRKKTKKLPNSREERNGDLWQ
jgi:hypothetical protein